MKPTNQIGRATRWPVSTQDTVRAIVQNRYGSADVLRLEQITRPAIADNEVLLRVQAADLDRGTWHLMTGHPYLLRLAFGLRRPKNPVPTEMSPGRLSLSVGEQVYGIAALHGTLAEYGAAWEDRLARKPGNLSFEQAAVIPVSAMTALQQNQGPGAPGGRSA